MTLPQSFRTIGLVLVMLNIASAEVGQPAPRTGDEIVVCGQFFHTTAPVVLWLDPGGYDAYRVERRFSLYKKSDWDSSKAEVPELLTPCRYGLREQLLTAEEIERVRGGGWDLPLLERVVDQFVMHYDVCGSSQTCFKVLHDARCLSVHFMLDVDGTIYQTLDLKERAWHATTSNTRSIGIEIASMGAYPPENRASLDRWYAQENGAAVLKPPTPFAKLGVRTPDFVGRPARPKLVTGVIQGTELAQYDFTPQQYESLTKLTATLCKIFPNLPCEYPRDTQGQLIREKLGDSRLANYHGVLGHYHIQLNKTDPGPAFDWERVIGGAKELMK